MSNPAINGAARLARGVASAGESILLAAGLSIDKADARCWRVTAAGKEMVFLYWPATGSWRSEDRARQGYSPTTLVAVMQSPAQKPDEGTKSPV